MASEFLEYILELLEPLGGITFARMFGGYAIRKNGLPIALLFNDEVFFKVDDSNRADYEALGSEPFTYQKNGKTIIISNWKLPLEILEDSDELMQWVEKSYQVARRARKKKKELSQ
jgi:DNA transformation protein